MTACVMCGLGAAYGSQFCSACLRMVEKLKRQDDEREEAEAWSE